MFWKILILVVFFVVTIGIGLYYRQKAKNVNDFVLGGRTVGPWLTAFAYGTTYFSAVVFVGYAGQFGWTFGISATWIGIGNALLGSMFAWILLGRRTRIMTKHLETSTMPEFFEKRYNSKSLKIFSSVLIFIFLIPYSASVYKGLSGIFSIAFHINFNYCIVGMAVITAIYVVAGGYMATAVNDFIQGIIMIIGIFCVVGSVLAGKGGFTQAIESLSQIPSTTAPNLNGAFASMFGPDPLNLLSVFILTSIGTWGLPQMAHKFYAIKNEKSIRIGTIISTLFALLIAGGSYFMGGFGRLYYTIPAGATNPVFDDIVPTMLSNQLPDALIGVVLILVLSASMSTLSSLVIASSSTFILDFVGSLTRKELSGKFKVFSIRILCAVFIAISVIIAVNPNALITTLMSVSWGALAGAFLGPFMYGLFSKNTTKSAVWICMLIGIGIVIANSVYRFTSPIMAGAISIMLSLITVPLISLVTPKPDKKLVDDIFECYNENVTVHSTDALEEQ